MSEKSGQSPILSRASNGAVRSNENKILVGTRITETKLNRKYEVISDELAQKITKLSREIVGVRPVRAGIGIALICRLDHMQPHTGRSLCRHRFRQWRR